jgi:hypothetical protein
MLCFRHFVTAVSFHDHVLGIAPLLAYMAFGLNMALFSAVEA